jgi:predicted nuclease of predicted toxin-antitoxin system
VKALIDQNLSFRLVDILLPRFPGSCHVRDVGLVGVDDERIWRFAKDEGFSIVTKDNDFLARALVRGHPPQVIQVCLGNVSTRRIAEVLQSRADDIERFATESAESAQDGCEGQKISLCQVPETQSEAREHSSGVVLPAVSGCHG